MVVTDTLNGRTVEDVRRNIDGSVTFYCDSGHTLTLYVEDSQIKAKPRDLIVSPEPERAVELPGDRMRLREAFQGHTVNYAYYGDAGDIIFVCEPLRHDREAYAKSSGHREITVAHSKGLIDELPPVSAIITIPSLSFSGAQG